MEEDFLPRPPPLNRLSASLFKARVTPFMKPGRDLETSLRSVLTMESLTMNLCKYSMKSEARKIDIF